MKMWKLQVKITILLTLL